MTDHDKVLALSGVMGVTSPTIADTIAAFTANLQKAVAHMGVDDLTFELDASGDRLRVRLRAYKHQRDNGSR